jgi:hypothetical protein
MRRILLVLADVFWHHETCSGLHYSVSNPPALLKAYKSCQDYKQSTNISGQRYIFNYTNFEIPKLPVLW